MIESKASECKILLQAIQGHNHTRRVYQRLKNCCSAKLHFRGMYNFTEMCFTIMIEGKASECKILLQAIQGHNHLRGVMSSGVYQRLKN